MKENQMSAKDAVLEASSTSTKPEIYVSVRTSYDPETETVDIWAHRGVEGSGQIEVFCQEKQGAIFVETLTIAAGQKDSPIQQRQYPNPWTSSFYIFSITPSEDSSYKYVVAPENRPPYIG